MPLLPSLPPCLSFHLPPISCNHPSLPPCHPCTQRFVSNTVYIEVFSGQVAKKYCYVIPVIKGGKYLIRTTYYYGGFDGGNEPPVFEQIIDGTKWGIVNTTEDYAKGLTSYYEIVVAAMGKTLSVCLARNGKTVSSPFITALELENMEASVYNSTDFTKYALNVVARHSFAPTMISFGKCTYTSHG
ncbi:putative LRR receptor-like serine/threonine-protein kinase [Vitis vinifera]|uniref:Putative LRR receptor-like serine/threonine-protein kinase n=1 Tax=Vitis vinifera TaxID=29760 RepID=A0A438EQE6_VITVI|nr:putative LRR receptor-like serine/threonine-protein kinase [Vitis vinifera]